jgi:hypothetical protein
MALEMPAVADHPNRHPFKGVLTKLDQPSTRPPEGSGNRRVILPREVAQSALSSILGMAVDYQNAVGHDPQKKIGVITAAHIVGDDVTVEGFFYAKDFPAEVAEIRALGARMGMSYELADVRVESLDAPILTIASCVFTGAAILLRDKAAYHATSLAAAAEQEENPMEELIKQLMAQSTSQTEVLGKLLEAQTATNTLLAAANVAKEEQDDTDGDSADGGAKPGKRDEVKAKAKKGAKAPDEEADDMDAGADAVTTQLAAMAAEIATLKAAAAKPPIVPPGEPDRKTLSGDVLTLLAKAGVGSSVNDEGKLSAAALDEALSKTAMNVTERLAFKTSLRKAGALEVQ